MRYLLDTNILIDYVTEDYISNDIQELITDYENLIYVSSESIKEFIHLTRAGKVIPSKEFRTPDVFDLIENTLGFQVIIRNQRAFAHLCHS